MRSSQPVTIDITLAKHLIAEQFPQFKDLPIEQVLPGGWDNRTFRLGNDKLARLPSSEAYADKVAKEQYWLPRLAPSLPLSIPEPVAMGEPTNNYPWPWSIYRWIEGETAASITINVMPEFAKDLAHFLLELYQVDTTGGPPAGAHNFYRGCVLTHYNAQTKQAIELLKDKIDCRIATNIWNDALETSWSYPPVWVHGDISPGNLLVRDNNLSAVIDFGGLAVGDPACDLAIAWTFFNAESREVFKQRLNLDEGTWLRGKAWALWKALIVASGVVDSNEVEKIQAWPTIEAIINSYSDTCF